MPLQVELVSADSRVWAGEASMVVARTTEGEIGILTGHSPLLAVLTAGEVRVDAAGEGGTVVADVSGGFLSVENDRVTVVSDAAALTSGSRSA